MFPDGMPVGEWIGYRYLVFDADDGVHLQLHVDTTDGATGGGWLLVTESVDRGGDVGETRAPTGSTR